MTYIHIPVDFQNPTDEDFAAFCSVMEQLKEVPVHVTASLTTGSRPFIDIVAMCLAWMRAGRERIWRRFGTPRECGRGLSAARLIRATGPSLLSAAN